jgi:hypothetical protein
MQMSLEIDNNFFPHFKAMIDSFVKDNKISVVKVGGRDTVDAPESVIVSRVEEVRRRVALAEERVSNGEYLLQEEYEQQMDKFFKEELGIER